MHRPKAVSRWLPGSGTRVRESPNPWLTSEESTRPSGVSLVIPECAVLDETASWRASKGARPVMDLKVESGIPMSRKKSASPSKVDASVTPIQRVQSGIAPVQE